MEIFIDLLQCYMAIYCPKALIRLTNVTVWMSSPKKYAVVMTAYATEPIHQCLRVREEKLTNKLRSSSQRNWKKIRRTCASGKTKAL